MAVVLERMEWLNVVFTGDASAIQELNDRKQDAEVVLSKAEYLNFKEIISKHTEALEEDLVKLFKEALTTDPANSEAILARQKEDVKRVRKDLTEVNKILYSIPLEEGASAAWEAPYLRSLSLPGNTSQ